MELSGFFLLLTLSMQETNNDMSFKGHNSVVKQQKFIHNNPNLDLVKVNAHAIFDQIPPIHSQDTEWKTKSGQ